MTVEHDVAVQLVARFAAMSPAVTGWTVGSNVREGFIEKEAVAGSTTTNAVPGACIFVIPTGGMQTERWLDGTSLTGMEKPTVQLLIRSARNKQATGRALADSCWRAMDAYPPTGYLECRVLAPPAFVHKDEDDHFLFSLNLRLVKQL